MPTTVVKTIRASGGDYTTLTAWEAANQGNLVTADEIRVAECYDDWATGLDDKLVIDGSTTDATRYLMITVAAGHRHSGVPRSGFYVKRAVGYDALLRDSDLYTRLEWLDLENTNSNGNALYANAGSGVYGNLIAKTAGTSQYVVGLYGQNITIHGALFYGGGSGVQLNSTIAANIYNSVATGCVNGFNPGSSTLAVLKNCVAYNNTTNYSGTFSASSTNNATSSASDDAPGPGSVVGITSADFVNAASNDFHLAAGSALIGAGVNLYADFQADVDGDAWPSSGAWDIGFDYYVSAGGTSTVTSDLADSYALRSDVSGDLADSYLLRADIASDLADSYNLRADVSGDLGDSYLLRAGASADLGDSYDLRGDVSNDLGDSYLLRNTTASDLADSYAVDNASSVASELADSYLVRAGVAGDLADAYALRAGVVSDLGDAYVIDSASGVGSSLADSYDIRAAVVGDLPDSYAVRANVSGDLSEEYYLLTSVDNNLADRYLLRNYVAGDLGDSYLLDGVAAAVLSAPRTTYSNTQTATRRNAQTARRPRA